MVHGDCDDKQSSSLCHRKVLSAASALFIVGMAVIRIFITSKAMGNQQVAQVTLESRNNKENMLDEEVNRA